MIHAFLLHCKISFFIPTELWAKKYHFKCTAARYDHFKYCILTKLYKYVQLAYLSLQTLLRAKKKHFKCCAVARGYFKCGTLTKATRFELYYSRRNSTISNIHIRLTYISLRYWEKRNILSHATPLRKMVI